MQGSFSVWTEHKKGHAKVKDLARFKPMQRHLFLHEKALLFCKRREENGEGYEKAPSYSFKQSLNVSPSKVANCIWFFFYWCGNKDAYFSSLFIEQMRAVGITENAKGDNKKFEIWCNSREEVYIVQVNKQRLIKNNYWANTLIMVRFWGVYILFVSGTNGWSQNHLGKWDQEGPDDPAGGMQRYIHVLWKPLWKFFYNLCLSWSDVPASLFFSHLCHSEASQQRAPDQATHAPPVPTGTVSLR